MKRYYQVAIWMLVAPILGAVQAIASMFPVMLEHGDLASHDLHRVLIGLALVYGGGWFISALVLADLLLLRRTLSPSELAGYLAGIAVTALVIGLSMSGMLLMIGYPATACAIFVWGFWRRRSSQKAAASGQIK